MNIALWIIQIFLAAFFLTVGSIKLVFPNKNLVKVFEWIVNYSENKVKTIGAFEILGAFGLFLPGVYGIAEVIIPLAAAGIAVIMALAAFSHYNRGEKKDIILNTVIFLFLAVIVVGRFPF